ncbi:MAG: hypothetical protein UH249_00215, partial [Acutalibacteraceae bacterium]|nr:hypothetical protein [Acutalibacteraceae bacterium]
MEKEKQVKNSQNSQSITKKDVSNSVKNTIRKIVLGLLLIVFVVSAAYLVNTLILDRPPDDSDTPTVDHENTHTAIDPNSGAVIQDKYSALLKMNEDFVGKLIIDATGESGINVVQTDNNYTYLNT